MYKKISGEETYYRQTFEVTRAVKLIIDPSDGSIVDANSQRQGLCYAYYDIFKLCRLVEKFRLTVDIFKGYLFAELFIKRKPQNKFCIEL